MQLLIQARYRSPLELYTEADKVVLWLATGKEADGVIVITPWLILILVNPVESLIDSWVLFL
jgi:hypothetical protein